MRTLLIACLFATAVCAQDVTIGGRVDLEARLSRKVSFGFGPEAGLDLTFVQPGLLHGYADLRINDDRLWLDEFYLMFPPTRRVVDVTLGRFRFPHGSRDLDRLDRYASGAPSFLTEDGDVLFDTYGQGLMLSREFDLGGFSTLTGALYGVNTRGDNFAWGGQLEARRHGFQGVAGWFHGQDKPGTNAYQVILGGGWEGSGVSVLGHYLFGEATAGRHTGYQARLAYALPAESRLPFDVFVARTAYLGQTSPDHTTTRLGVGYRFGRFYRAELRYELNEAPGDDGQDRLIARLTAVF
ncbi:MAG TPA: hypothetical protein DCZ72_11265 [Armatimonadetes bacterium]|nr:hypothetical protein [Armatimonadota bacterium]